VLAEEWREYLYLAPGQNSMDILASWMSHTFCWSSVRDCGVCSYLHLVALKRSSLGSISSGSGSTYPIICYRACT
jgi:hypothetical protein